MAIFIIGVVIFLSTRKKGLHRQGILYMYRTQLGVKFIDNFAKKYEKILRPMQYVVIACGYFLMISMIWLLGKTTYLYLTTSVSKFIKAPPIAPLVPYFPKIFGLQSYFPPLYFTYFIIAIVLVAVFHEAAHGIYARFYKFKIHSTGFVFLGPILGAFVEPDEKQMAKAKKIPQLSVLAAGTFANLILFVVFGLIMILFFKMAFVPAGVQFNTYALSEVDVKDITVIGDSDFSDKLVEINVKGVNYTADKDALKIASDNEIEKILVYDKSPAIKAKIELGEAISEIDGQKIDSYEKLREVLSEKSPGQSVEIKTLVAEQESGKITERKSYALNLSDKNGKAFLGVGFLPQNYQGFVGFLYKNTLAKVKNPLVFYESKIGEFGWFIYYLLWWIVIINISVALFNMMPLGMLDGGKFFLLTVAGLTKKENLGKKAYKYATIIIAAVFILLMIKWLVGFF